MKIVYEPKDIKKITITDGYYLTEIYLSNGTLIRLKQPLDIQEVLAEICPICSGQGKIQDPDYGGTDIKIIQCHGCFGLGWVTVRD